MVLNIIKQDKVYYLCPNTKDTNLHVGILSYDALDEMWRVIQSSGSIVSDSFTGAIEEIKEQLEHEYDEPFILKYL